MPANNSEKTLLNRLTNTVNDLQKQLKQMRTSQLTPPAWTAPTFLNSWSNYGAPFTSAGYYIDGLGIVHLKGMVRNGTISASIFQLPVGFRPLEQYLFVVETNSNANGRVDIQTDGNVIAGANISNTWVSLDPISFRTS
jgi:hypothetical protein